MFLRYISSSGLNTSLLKFSGGGFHTSSFCLESELESRLYTPGPVQVSDSVRLATSRKTLGSREPEFVDITASCREKLLKIADLSSDYGVVLMQGSGTYGVESTIQTIVPDDARLLCVTNGSFGERMAKIASVYLPQTKHVEIPYEDPVDIDELGNLIEEFAPTHLAMVHSETSTGTINDIEEIGKRFCKDQDLVLLVDGISSFGGCNFNIEECGIDFLMTSPNKCMEALSGVAIIFGRKDLMEISHSRTVSLDLIDQYKFFEECNMFRFTPPVEVVVALEQACVDLLEESVVGRTERYLENATYVREEMERIGFEGYLTKENNGHIVSIFDYPDTPKFDFLEFYTELVDVGCRIYYFPGQRLDRGVIRIGTIGSNDINNFKVLIDNVERICKEKGYFD